MLIGWLAWILSHAAPLTPPFSTTPTDRHRRQQECLGLTARGQQARVEKDRPDPPGPGSTGKRSEGDACSTCVDRQSDRPHRTC